MRTDEHIVTRHQSPDRVPGEDAAERLLSLVTSRRRARAIVGDLAEQAEGSTAWFWQCTLRIAAACARQNLFSVSTRETAMSNDSFSLITTIWRHKWLLATCVLVSVISTRIALAFYPATYRSETSILVVPQRVPESYVRATVTARIEDRLNTITQQILSRTRLQRIINEYNLYADRLKNTEMEDVVQAMRNDIRTHVLRGDAFRISYDGNNPRTVQKVTERLASLFIEENLNDRATLADSTIQFLEAQVEETRR
jgi:capsular polysaccharide biosynthesis protein